MEHTGAMATTFVGTFKYMSPERIQSKPYNYKSDIWSAGIVLIELATGHNPYSMEKLNHIELVQTILESPEPQLPAGRFSPGLSELVSHCMKKDPEARLPADILLAAPWFTENGATNIESSVWLVKQWLDS
jgi:serine/threonine protein kinase